MIRTLRQLRQFRWLAAALLIASPAVGGQALALLHPCPATGSTSVAEAPAPAGEHHHGAAPAAPAHDHDASQSCTCLGSCDAPATTAAPVGVIASMAPGAALRLPSWPLVEAGAPVAAAAERLPPKTAPPLV